MPLPLFVASRTFDPRRIPGLQAWYDAADSASVTLDAGRVSQWSDKSGNGRHATNTTSGSTQPSYTTAARNGLNVLRFAAASVQRLTVPSSTAAFNFLHDGTESWWIGISKYATATNPDAIYSLFGNNAGSSANTGVYIAWDNRTSLSVFRCLNNLCCASGFVINFAATSQTGGAFLSAYQNIINAQEFVAQEAVHAPANTTLANRFRLRINGGSEIAANDRSGAVTSANASFNFQIGCMGNNVLPMQGDICELMFFNQVPTAAARDLIRRYLGAKWGVTVA